MKPWLAHRGASMDHDDVERIQRRFPQVEARFVPWTDTDPCGGCPEGAFWGANESTARIVYGRHGVTYTTPVGGCCAVDELRDLTAGNVYYRADWVRIEFLLFETRADGHRSARDAA